MDGTVWYWDERWLAANKANCFSTLLRWLSLFINQSSLSCNRLQRQRQRWHRRWHRQRWQRQHRQRRCHQRRRQWRQRLHVRHPTSIPRRVEPSQLYILKGLDSKQMKTICTILCFLTLFRLKLQSLWSIFVRKIRNVDLHGGPI